MLRLVASVLFAAVVPPARGARLAVAGTTDIVTHEATDGAARATAIVGAAEVPSVGQACTGNWLFGSGGGCGRHRVTDLDGTVSDVQLKCFKRDALKADELADRGERGICLIPKNEKCEEDEQCRSGTSCQPRGFDAVHRCREVCAECDADGEDDAGLAVRVAAVVRSMARSLSQSDLLRGTPVPGKFMDARSGALSPFVAQPAVAQHVLREVSVSFETAEIKGEDAASRSGSLFAISGDGRFLAKSVRETEYKELTGHLLDPMAKYLNLRDITCQPSAMDYCWVEGVLSRTTLNVPVLAFVHDGRYWVVMPAGAQMRGLAVSHSVGSLQPWGAATYYDLKPVWAKSSARPDFMKLLTELDFHPTSGSAPAEMRTQWAKLQAAVERDLDFIASEESDEDPYIDYSLLFEVYTPSRRVDVAGKNCIEGRSCFKDDATSCWVICISIIDFYEKFSMFRYVESVVKSFKFHNYARKTKEMFRCAFSQNMSWTGETSLIDGVASSTSIPSSRVVNLTTSVNASIGFAGILPDPVDCDPYLEMACGKFLGNGLWSIVRTECQPWWVALISLPRTCSKATCSFSIKAEYLEHCGGWLQAKCRHDLDMHNYDERSRAAHSNMLLQNASEVSSTDSVRP